MALFRPSRADNHLSTYWNALVRNAPAEELARLAARIEPSELAAIHRARAAHRRYDPDPVFARRLEQTLMDTSISPVAGTMPQPRVSPPTTNGAHDRGRARPGVSGHRWGRTLVPALEIGLIILLILASIAGIWLTTGRDDDPRIIVPPVATPTTETTSGWTHFKGDASRRGVTNFGPSTQPAELWHYQANAPCFTAPAIFGGTVYAACDDGTLYALDVATGSVHWEFAAEPFTDGPTVAGDLIYVVGASGTLYAVEIATGQERWRFDDDAVFGSPAVADGILVIPADGGMLAGIDAETGTERWRYQITTEGAARTPALLGGIAYVGSESGDFTAISTESGELVWFVDTGDLPTGTAVVADRIAYIGVAAEAGTGSLAAYDAETGALIWQRDEPIHSPSVSNGIGYAGSADGTVYAFDTATGDERWRIQVGGVARPLAVAGDIIYVPSDDDRAVYAIAAGTGEILWQVDVDGGINGQAAVADGIIAVTTTLGAIQAFGEGIPGGEMQSPAVTTPAPVATPAATAEASPASATPAATTVVDAPMLLWTAEGGAGPFDSPGKIAIDPQGRIWVTDTGNGRFQIFDADGTFLETWGEPGSGDGQFSFLRADGDGFGGLAIAPDGSIFVLDVGNRRIQAFDANRTFLTSWGESGRDPGQFLDPIGIAVAPDGTVWVLDGLRNDIQHFDASGQLLGSVPTFPDGNGPTNSINGVWIDAEGNLHIEDMYAYEIRVLAPDGTVIRTYGEYGDGVGQFTGQIESIVFLPNGQIVAAEGGMSPFEPGRFHLYAPDGTPLGTWSVETGVHLGLAADDAGNVYLANYLENTIQKFQFTVPAVATPIP